ncbi:MAG: energy transducer TonB, partial [Chitinophagaceae bacterium]
AGFMGGQTAWQTYLKNNLDVNVPVKNHAPAGQYSVDVQFIVSTNGSINGVRTVTNHGYGMEEEAIRIIKNGPRWQPAMQNGHIVTAYHKQTITFSVGNGSAQDASAIKLGDVVYVSYLDKSSPAQTTNTISDLSPVEPGSSYWKRYFERNINLTATPGEKLVAGLYNLYVRFAVDSKGNVSEPVVLNYAGSGMAAACEAVISHIHKVIPSAETIANGKTWYFQPVSFHIIDPSEKIVNTIPTISVIELKKANANTLLKLKDDVSIKSFTFTTDLSNGDIAAIENNGNQISAGIIKLINGIYAGNLITIDNIILLENGKEKKVPSLIYEVVN